MSESVGLYFFFGGIGLALLGYLCLIVAAFRHHKAWGVALLLVFPAIFFVFAHFRKAVAALLVMLLGVAVFATPYVVNRFHPPVAEEKPIETQTGEPTLTVTGVKDFDYATLKGKTYLEVLQMANEDVTDQTLEHLKGMTKLRELDLSNTAITDEGLKILKQLPKLEILHLNRTKVTEEGIRESIFPIETLKELNLRNTKVTKKTRDEWKAAKEGRKVTPAF
jgi:hypothetical protein